MFPEAEASESIEATSTEAMGGPAIGTLDIFLLSLSVGVGVYWFFFRKKAENKTEGLVNPITSSSMTMSSNSGSGFITKMKSSSRNVVVFYGSQTGTGEEFSVRLAKEAQRYGLKGMVADPEENEMEDLSQLADIENSLAIFCVATYGEGDPTDNAQEFYDWLQDGNGDLSGVKYTVFGLGNKTYEHYNAMGKYLDKRLEELGGERIFELGLGDDDQNIEEDFVTWKDRFWPAVCEYYGLEATGDESNIRQYAVTEHTEDVPEKVFSGEVARLNAFKNQKPPYDAKNPYLSAITVNRELHQGGDRSCMHIEFDISGSRIRYESGDHVAVYPTNDPELVAAIGKILDADLDTVFTLTNVDEEASKKHPFPCPTSYQTAFSHYLDITSCPRANVLKEISEYATDPADKEKLLLMSSATPEGKKEYSDWVTKCHRNIVAILEDLPSVKVPLDHLCELLPRLHARYYSISSSPKVSPDRISITAVLIRYTTPTGRIGKGVATNWLKDKIPNGPETTPFRVPIYVRKSQFRLPFKTTTPVIMVGPGTGLAPFRGFIQERDFYRKDETKKVGDSILFFGCRKSTEDYIYKDELDEYLKNGTLTNVHVAFSRETEEKLYVQHLMKRCQKQIWGMLEKGSHIYVCGDARFMAPDVQRTIREIICQEGGKTQTEAEDYIKKMQSKGRYSCDVWS
ncbi:NADPH--cytochrome P450 reductase [Strongylocentrotus purpuratus]|uniref:NADPH--cytochrome P450 reductase n=1 Tax=Strongylocentrotus purpuratus TaxID=7668 RepID=A0A7M7PET6_STRPU|nr:NADPH--cytochrome P450 reductase [Strongylocentrotus purpuratus]|eukprot:XP_799192.3 PREDICTED: NADPH--cytochrome P450 reductase isoform X2 [Strongylocentrotus purpuratus]